MAETHLFVDTNVLLDFYSYTKDDLDQLQSLIDNIHPQGIRLHLPQHVLNELERNREAKLKTSAEQFKKESCPTAIPRHMEDYPQAKEYKDAVDAALKLRVFLINQAATDAGNRTLAADKKIDFLVKEKAEVYPEDGEAYLRALERMHKGNPPGKSGSVGDQYNWEVMLKKIPNEDLHIVSKDGDYSSLLNSDKPHPFLQKEWWDKKQSNLHIYKELRTFIGKYLAAKKEKSEDNKHISKTTTSEGLRDVAIDDLTIVPEEHSSSDSLLEMTTNELKKSLTLAIDDAIQALASSYNPDNTHTVLIRLEQFRTVLNNLDEEFHLESALDNSQMSLKLAIDDALQALVSHPNPTNTHTALTLLQQFRATLNNLDEELHLELLLDNNRISVDVEKEEAIQALVSSSNFANTHSAIARLQQLRSTLNYHDVERLLEAAFENNQIAWIASDDDVFAFFTSLLSEHQDIDAKLHEAALGVFGKLTEES